MPSNDLPGSTREVHLVSRPIGEPKESDFEIADIELPSLQPGQALVRNLWLSVDPYMRPKMDDVKSYTEPYGLRSGMEGGAVGEVLASQNDAFKPGDLVVHYLGWREHAIVDDEEAEKIDTTTVSPTAYLGVLGVPGMTAWIGLLDVAQLRDGDVIFVSGAAGAVGSVVGQLAAARGHQVIGTAGTPEKVRHVIDDLGFSAAFDYHGDIPARLAELAPNGIDVYFDNVGGAQLEAAIDAANDHARFALCGSISQYNDRPGAQGPRNLWQAVTKRLKFQGYIVTEHYDRLDAFMSEVVPLVASGALAYRETFVDGGLEAMPGALIDLLRGANIGKMLVRL